MPSGVFRSECVSKFTRYVHCCNERVRFGLLRNIKLCVQEGNYQVRQRENVQRHMRAPGEEEEATARGSTFAEKADVLGLLQRNEH